MHCYYVRTHKHGDDYNIKFFNRGVCFHHDYNVSYPSVPIYYRNGKLYCTRCNKE